MKKTKLLLTCALALATLLAACDSSSSGTSTSNKASCGGHFEASVNKTNILEGSLKIDVDDAGKLSGTLSTATGTNVTVSGQVIGQAISIAATLGGDQYLFGAGTLTQPIGQCGGVAGGTFSVETIKASGSGLPGLAAPAGQITVEDKSIGIWGYAIGG